MNVDQYDSRYSGSEVIHKILHPLENEVSEVRDVPNL